MVEMVYVVSWDNLLFQFGKYGDFECEKSVYEIC
jgi:hypothetical protein